MSFQNLTGIRFVTLTNSDTDNFEERPHGIHCNVGGDAVLVNEDETTEPLTFISGNVYPYAPIRINATGSAATFTGVILNTRVPFRDTKEI